MSSRELDGSVNSEPGLKADPLVVFTRFEYPKRSDFSAEELAAVLKILPDYEGKMLLYTPHPFKPTRFKDVKAMEAKMHTGEVNIVRSKAVETLATERSEFFRENAIDINTFLREKVFPTGREVYALRFDEFPSDIPDDTNHFNLWLSNPDLTPDELSVVVADCLRVLGITPAETVIIEKKKEARLRAETMVKIPGQTPSAPDIRHPHLYVVKKPTQPSYDPLHPS